MNKCTINLVLSAKLDKEGNLTNEGKRRVELAVDNYTNNLTDLIIMSGRQAFSELLDFDKSHADLMKAYAEKICGGDKISILEEQFSLETIAQPLFSKLLLLEPSSCKNVQIISSDYHENRVMEICNLILGKDYRINFKGIETGLKYNKTTLDKEKKSLQAFRNTFKGINIGDIESAIVTLFTKHPIYSDLLKAMKEFENLTDSDYSKLFGVMQRYSVRGKNNNISAIRNVLKDYLHLNATIKFNLGIDLLRLN